MFNQFQGETGGYKDMYGTEWYRSDALLSVNSSFEDFSAIMKDYCVIWYDFVSFRIDLFETKLKSLFYKKLNCSIKDINYFYSYFEYYRNHFAVLPTQITQYTYIPKVPEFDLYQEIAKYFSNSNNYNSIGIKKMNNINPILVYYYIWNCIYCIMHKNKGSKFGFDCQIVFESNEDFNIFFIDSNKICKLLQEYIIDQLAQTNNKNCKYCKAGVNTYDRCLIKSSTDYGDELRPNAACILDFLRCSIT